MKDAISQFENPDVTKYNQMMLSMYFGTLESIYVISRQLGYTHTHLPSFSSQLLVEVTKDAVNGVMVGVSYNKQAIKLGGDCNGEEKCKYNSFLSLTATLKAAETEISGCKPASDLLFLTQSVSSTIGSSDGMNVFIIFMCIAGAISLLIGAALGHKVAQKENKRRRVKVDVFDQEALLKV